MKSLDELAIPTLETMLKLMQKSFDVQAINDLAALIHEARPDLTPEKARALAQHEAYMLASKVVEA